MTIIKIDPEWNGSHCSLENVDYILPGWAELPPRFTGVWERHKPFVNLDMSPSGAIVGVNEGEEIVFPEPKPTPTERDRMEAQVLYTALLTDTLLDQGRDEA